MLEFARSPQPIMRLEEWHTFLQHPNAQRLEGVNLIEQPALCDAVAAPQLSELPLLLNVLLLPLLPAPVSYLEPLVDCPSLTVLGFRGAIDSIALLPVSLEPLTRCTRLRSLTLEQLNLRAGQLSELLIQLAQTGGQLRELRLFHLRMLPMNDSVLDVAPEPADSTLDLELTPCCVFLDPSS
jgi:hypothetical protein